MYTHHLLAGFGVTLNPEIPLSRPYPREIASPAEIAASKVAASVSQDEWLGRAALIGTEAVPESPVGSAGASGDKAEIVAPKPAAATGGAAAGGGGQ